MPTRIVFAAPGVKGGVLTQVFVEEPEQVLEAFAAANGAPFTLTARTRRPRPAAPRATPARRWKRARHC